MRLLVALANVMNPVTYCPGETICVQNDVVPVLWLFKSGLIEVYINDELFNTHDCSEGIGFGDLELLVDRPRHATIKAKTLVEGWTIDRENLIKAISHQLDLRRELIANYQAAFLDYAAEIAQVFERPMSSA